MTREQAVERLAAVLNAVVWHGGAAKTLESVTGRMQQAAYEGGELAYPDAKQAARDVLDALGLVAVPAELVERVRQKQAEADAPPQYEHMLEVVDAAKIELADAVLAQLGGGR